MWQESWLACLVMTTRPSMVVVKTYSGVGTFCFKHVYLHMTRIDHWLIISVKTVSSILFIYYIPYIISLCLTRERISRLKNGQRNHPRMARRTRKRTRGYPWREFTRRKHNLNIYFWGLIHILVQLNLLPRYSTVWPLIPLSAFWFLAEG